MCVTLGVLTNINSFINYIFSVTSKHLDHPVLQHPQVGVLHLLIQVHLQGALVMGMERVGDTITGVGEVETRGVEEDKDKDTEGIEEVGLPNKDRGRDIKQLSPS